MLKIKESFCIFYLFRSKYYKTQLRFNKNVNNFILAYLKNPIFPVDHLQGEILSSFKEFTCPKESFRVIPYPTSLPQNKVLIRSHGGYSYGTVPGMGSSPNFLKIKGACLRFGKIDTSCCISKQGNDEMFYNNLK